MPGSTNEMFYLLEENGLINHNLTEKMVGAVGFRNLMVHEYEKIDLGRVFEYSHKDFKDLNQFITSIFTKLQIRF